MLNDPSMIDAAVGLAHRALVQESQSEIQRLQSVFEIATSRKPTEKEVASLQKLLANEKEYYGEHSEQAESLVRSIEYPNQAELAAWTSVARAVLNMYETMSRN